MHLFTIKLIISLFIFQSFTNSKNSESKISIADSFKKADSGMVSPHSPFDTIPQQPSQPPINKNPLVKANKPLSDVIPPLPPPPPIDRKSLVKASKLALYYSSNRSLADKKYKRGRLVTVEGIVKEIIEIDYLNTTIILDGAPSKIDLQFERLTPRRIKNLKKGMKAIFIAQCDGLNGNVIFSGCIYLEKPTYE
ncbi:MAG: hypothetical protein IPI88_12805 [Chitinophagaceae bacterium]|nr:hypothetical protein [Chitinophagaceae bacterium]